jgi:hypothetical protein
LQSNNWIYTIFIRQEIIIQTYYCILVQLLELLGLIALG